MKTMRHIESLPLTEKQAHFREERVSNFSAKAEMNAFISMANEDMHSRAGSERYAEEARFLAHKYRRVSVEAEAKDFLERSAYIADLRRMREEGRVPAYPDRG